jgi:uncharacterized protein YggU (UPF0235/DUF167 family)
MRVTVRVRPGASRTHVGGRYGSGEPPVLVVSVTAPAVDGRANTAVLVAVADALGVRRGAVRLVRGDRARTKVLDINGVEQGALDALLTSG